jgi:hypothetical protein
MRPSNRAPHLALRFSRLSPRYRSSKWTTVSIGRQLSFVAIWLEGCARRRVRNMELMTMPTESEMNDIGVSQLFRRSPGKVVHRTGNRRACAVELRTKWRPERTKNGRKSSQIANRTGWGWIFRSLTWYCGLEWFLVLDVTKTKIPRWGEKISPNYVREKQ